MNIKIFNLFTFVLAPKKMSHICAIYRRCLIWWPHGHTQSWTYVLSYPPRTCSVVSSWPCPSRIRMACPFLTLLWLVCSTSNRTLDSGTSILPVLNRVRFPAVWSFKQSQGSCYIYDVSHRLRFHIQNRVWNRLRFHTIYEVWYRMMLHAVSNKASFHTRWSFTQCEVSNKFSFHTVLNKEFQTVWSFK